MKPARPAPDPDRRRFLAGGCRLAAASLCLPLLPFVPLLPSLGGCTGDLPEKKTAGPVRYPLDAMLPGDRVRIEHGDRSIELLRTDDGVTARLLLCTHQGCAVQWLPDDRIYLCPCHDGRFDADGNPIYGPPRRPLLTLPVRIEAGEVVVDV